MSLKSLINQIVREKNHWVFEMADTSRASQRERDLHKHLQKHGLTSPDRKSAGFSSERDVVIDHPRTKAEIGGKVRESIGGEVKDSVAGGKFGSVALRYDKDKGWYIPDSTKKSKPKLCEHIENSTVTGHDDVKRKLMDHLNWHYGASEVGKHLRSVRSDKMGMEIPNAYMQDHDVHFIHIGDRGTFRAGHSAKEDVHGTGLPPLEGHGQVVVTTERKRTEKQQADGTGMQASFRVSPKSVPQSDIDISTPEGAKKVHANLMRKKKK